MSATPNPDTDSKQSPSSKGVILIIDDFLDLLEGIQTILELDNYTVIPAENGRQALEALSQTTILPNLIISDIVMPEMDGFEFLKAVRNEPRWIGIPFIFLTAASSENDFERGKRLGVTQEDYLIKPFNPEDLLEMVENKFKK